MTPPEEKPMTAALRLPDLQDKHDWTVDDLATLPKDLHYELIDGRLILPSPTLLHQDICHDLVNMIRPYCPHGYRAAIDLSLAVDGQSEPRPDVVVLRQALGMRTPAPIEGALLVLEVISPTSHFRDMQAKTKIFAAAGVSGYWVIDPFDHEVTLTEFRRRENGVFEVHASTSKVFETDLPFSVTIDVPALTRLREEYRKAEQP
jgi:Uma2 family endonuclease